MWVFSNKENSVPFKEKNSFRVASNDLWLKSEQEHCNKNIHDGLGPECWTCCRLLKDQHRKMRRLECVGSSYRCSSAAAPGGELNHHAYFFDDDGRRGGGHERKCGGAAERSHSSAVETCKVQTAAPCPRNLAAKETAALRRPPRFKTFQKCLLFPSFRANTVRMRRRRDADAFESLLTLISAAPSCYRMILLSAPKSPTAFLGCFFGGGGGGMVGASNKLPPLIRLSRMLQQRRQFYGFLDLKRNEKTPSRA